MTIAVPTSGGWTFNATLDEDEFHMLWLVKGYGGTGTPHLRLLLSATFKTGWRIWTPRRPSARCSRRTGTRADGCSERLGYSGTDGAA